MVTQKKLDADVGEKHLQKSQNESKRIFPMLNITDITS